MVVLNYVPDWHKSTFKGSDHDQIWGVKMGKKFEIICMEVQDHIFHLIYFYLDQHAMLRGHAFTERYLLFFSD